MSELRDYSNPRETYELGYERGQQDALAVAIFWFVIWLVTFTILVARVVFS